MYVYLFIQDKVPFGVRAVLLQGSSLPERRAYEDDNLTTGSEHNMLYQIPWRKKPNPDRCRLWWWETVNMANNS